jgi:hypothetical protein
MAEGWYLGIRRASEKERCPVCLEEEDVLHILLECKEPKKWRVKYLRRKWLNLVQMRT